jgi:hypothetical protein
MDLVEHLLDLLGAAPPERSALTEAIRDGRQEELWRWLLADPDRVTAIGPINQARALALIGEHEVAAQTLHQLASTAPRNLLFVAADPVFAETRSLPLFRAALDGAGLGRALDRS